MSSFGVMPKPPLEEFFRRVDALATSAFLAIPYVGTDLADFFNQAIVPRFGPKRDRLALALFRRAKSLEGGLQVILMRLLPLPGPPSDPGRHRPG